MVCHRGTGSAALAALVALALWSCGTRMRNGAPRVGAIPGQATAGAAFALDLGAFVTDPEGAMLAYAVTAGGGAFTGSVYANTFDTLGTYAVQFAVADPAGKVAFGSFSVKVTAAKLAVLSRGDDLQLLDTDTLKTIDAATATGFAETLKATLADGHVVYERTAGTTRLFAYEPAARRNSPLGDSADADARFAGKTSAGRIVFVVAATATPTDTDLYAWDPATRAVTAIAAEAGSPEGNALVSAGDLVFYDRGTPSDVFYYDPSTGNSTAVASESTAEQVRAVLPNGGLVFSRVGPGGEQDLYYFHVASGVVEIGSDQSAAVQAQSKTFAGNDGASRVAFEALNGTHRDLYVWDPASGQSRALAATAADETFAAVTPAEEFVYHAAPSATNTDVHLYAFDTNTTRVVAATADNERFQGALGNGDVVILRQTAALDELHRYDTAGSALMPLATGGSDDYAFAAVLSNDKVVYAQAGASGGVFVVNTTGAPVPVQVAAAGSSFAAEMSGGDFAAHEPSGGRTVLVLWDESAASATTIAGAPGDDHAFGALTSTGKVLFLRRLAAKTTRDLFQLDPATSAETRLTDDAVDYGVAAVYAAATP